jgi:TusA-related sulfurtransferase
LAGRGFFLKKNKGVFKRMSNDSNPTLLDVRGEICPYPMIRTNKELDNSEQPLTALDVLTDHPPALSTIPPEAMKRGYGCEIEEVEAGEWKIRLFKSE